MKFRARKRSKKMPTVNLVPMMTAMLAILAFFVVLSTSLTTSERTTVQLPTAGTGPHSPSTTTPPLSILIDRNGQVLVDRRPIAIEALDAEIAAYLQQFPEGTIALDADPQIPYEQVLTWLERLKQTGGDRITLAIAEPAL